MFIDKGNGENLNSSFYSDLDTNFEQAFIMSEKHFSHSELLDLLQKGNIPQRQIAALKFDYVNDENDVQVLLSNLTGCDGKIREAIALTINRILSENIETRILFAKYAPKIFADSTVDINANICRLTVDSAVLLHNILDFSNKYASRILLHIKDAYEEIDKFIFRDKKYVINKQMFKLYWCLEALKYFYDYVDEEILKSVITKASDQKEYTVREKAAEILYVSGKFPNLAEQLKQDENYYVKAVFN